MKFIDEIATVLNISSSVLTEMAEYRARDGLWSNNFIWKNVNKMNPVLWWKGMCGSTMLSKVDIRILSAPVSSAESERSFSTFGFIHSLKRNRLTTDRAGQLTFIAQNYKYNLKVSVMEAVQEEPADITQSSEQLEAEQTVMIPTDHDLESESDDSNPLDENSSENMSQTDDSDSE